MKQVPVVLVMVGVVLGVASLSASAQVSPAPAEKSWTSIWVPWLKITADSRTLRSSRTFPGQG